MCEADRLDPASAAVTYQDLMELIPNTFRTLVNNGIL